MSSGCVRACLSSPMCDKLIGSPLSDTRVAAAEVLGSSSCRDPKLHCRGRERARKHSRP